MPLIKDVHQQFSDYFKNEDLKPYFYLLSKKLSEGNICLDITKIRQDELPDGYKLHPNRVLTQEYLISDGNEVKPLILRNNKLYFHRYYYYETMILHAIINLIASSAIAKNEKLEEANQLAALFDDLFPASTKSNEINWQRIAAIQSVLHNFTIITGGPGTGKTTTVAKILNILFQQNKTLKVALAAPTGKAAARMAESLNAAAGQFDNLKESFSKLQPFTIHRLLGYRKNSIHFKRNKDSPLNYDVIIIDEASMIDVALFAKLLNAVGPATKLILLGDKNQLASVEAGSLFGDLCMAQAELNYFDAGDKEIFETLLPQKEFELLQEKLSKNSNHPLFGHVIELRKSFRFSDEEGIGKFSKAVIENNQTTIGAFFGNTDARILIDTDYSPDVFYGFVSGFESYINEPDIKTALQKLNDLKVLCATREGIKSVNEMNRQIVDYLKHRKLISPDREFYENRPVMITKNDYELNLFNGDIGLVRYDEDGNLKVWFENGEEELKSVYPSNISQAETVFAMTVHKSQGSEFKNVLVMLPETEDLPILTRELIYTAVSRAKEKVTIQAPQNVVLAAANAKVVRGSGLAERFSEHKI